MPNSFLREEQNFLRGPRARWKELKYAVGVVAQFIKGFRALHFTGPCITIFGSARFTEGHPYYELARKAARQLALRGFAIMTGGGPGIMEAANRGAKEAGGISLGCNILLPQEQQHNPWLDRYVTIEYFFVRKELLRKYSFAFVAMPGGFGTLDELFETITLIQTGKIDAFPVVIMGVEYHKDLRAYIHTLFQQGAIAEADMKLILFTDSIEEMVQHILDCSLATSKILTTPRPSPLLMEKEIKKKAAQTQQQAETPVNMKE